MPDQETNSTVILQRYFASQTLSRFHLSDAMIRGVMGPIGSGKSVGMVQEIIRKAREQEPDKNGIRPTRWAIIRNTYGELKSTTIQTWLEWVPEEICPIVYDAPIRGRLQFPLQDGTRVDCQLYFIALDKPKDVKKLKSIEFTGIWINEAVELPEAVLTMAKGRLGRYPAKRRAPLTWSGIIMDTNPCDEDHWWYRLAELEKPTGHEFFRQPPALLEEGSIYTINEGQKPGIPAAENVEHQPKGAWYWLDQVHGNAEEWIKVFLMGEYGTTSDGKPVFPEYNDAIHYAGKPLEPYRGLPLILGWDYGLTPACIITQVSPRGQLRILREYVCFDGGIKSFARDVVRPGLSTHYPGMELISWGDPAGIKRMETDEMTCEMILAGPGIRIPTRGARTNNYTARFNAVKNFLNKMVDGKPGLLLSSDCKVLRKGLKSKYMFERLQVSGEEMYKTVPKKNIYSHITEALQYACLGIEGDNYEDDQLLREIAAHAAAQQRIGGAATVAGY